MPTSSPRTPDVPYPPFLLRQALNAAGMSQRRLARKLGWDESYVSRIARGMITPSWKTAIAIADAAGVSLDLFREQPTPAITIGPVPQDRPARRRRQKESRQ